MPPTEGTTPQHTVTKEPAPCRTCMDFKSWTKQQRKTLTTNAGKPAAPSELTVTKKTEEPDTGGGPPPNCPLDKEQLGRYTWGFLHTMAAYFPAEPSAEQQKDVRTFFSAFSRLYPCEYCAKDFQQELQDTPPETKTQHALAQWLCRMHNRVNEKLGKPEFDCSKVNERWRDGWPDGSCD